MQSPMRSNAMVVVEDFYDVSGYPYINFALNILIGHRVMHFIDRYVII